MPKDQSHRESAAPIPAIALSTSSLQVTVADSGIRLDLFLARRCSELSRNQWKELIASGQVLVNGRPAGKSLLIQSGWIIQLPAAFPAVNPLTLANSELAKGLNILYQDQDLLAIDKPACLPTHPLKADEHNTLYNALIAFDPAIAAAGPKPLEGGLVHRLDIQTSGVILAARNPHTFAALKACFSRHEALKTYLALIVGQLESDSEIDLAIAHHIHSGRRMVTMDLANDAVESRQSDKWRGKPRPASSQVHILERLKGHTLVEVRVRQAQMHQIRVHLHAIGHPLAGDAVYQLSRSMPQTKDSPGSSGMLRHALHAWRIELPHPRSGRPLMIEAPIPQDIAAAIQRLR